MLCFWLYVLSNETITTPVRAAADQRWYELAAYEHLWVAKHKVGYVPLKYTGFDAALPCASRLTSQATGT